MLERGRDYCRADSHMLYGHIEQVASSEAHRTVLLLCPQCEWLYEDDQRSEPVHVSTADARERFGFTFDG